MFRELCLERKGDGFNEHITTLIRRPLLASSVWKCDCSANEEVGRKRELPNGATHRLINCFLISKPAAQPIAIKKGSVMLRSFHTVSSRAGHVIQPRRKERSSANAPRQGSSCPCLLPACRTSHRNTCAASGYTIYTMQRLMYS